MGLKISLIQGNTGKDLALLNILNKSCADISKHKELKYFEILINDNGIQEIKEY